MFFGVFFCGWCADLVEDEELQAELNGERRTRKKAKDVEMANIIQIKPFKRCMLFTFGTFNGTCEEAFKDESKGFKKRNKAIKELLLANNKENKPHFLYIQQLEWHRKQQNSRLLFQHQ